MVSQESLRVFVVGASGSLGRCLAEEEAARGSNLVLVASDLRDLLPIQADLILKYKAKVEIVSVDFRESRASSKIELNGDRYYFPVGATMELDLLGTTSEKIERMMRVNFLSVASIIGNILSEPRQRRVDIIGFGSIAETRGRANNVYYSAAKRALTSLFESLRHGAKKENLRPYLFHVGYMRSQLSYGKKMLFPAVASKDVAKAVLHFINTKEAGIVYLPRYWYWICIIVRKLPWIIYQKLNF
ncbi:MAG: SDR family NAD(P)-dependent oxidoreductase [Bdellovibrionales bacterium]|nr:SDR family NAD(P)-dependent oxidoreductase [Bdellovibrionales bacterium]